MITICFTGHRPDKLGGYDWDSKKNILIMQKIVDIVEKLIINENAKTFIFGGALGIDQMAFECVKKIQEHWCHDLKMILAVPFEQQAIKWFKKEDVDKYNSQKEWADEIVYVDTVPGYEYKSFDVGLYHPAKMDLRNRWMVDNSDMVFAVYNGTKGGTNNCLNYARMKNKKVTGFNPDNMREFYE
jgi:uncharacterized phage-like protein YoqJ